MTITSGSRVLITGAASGFGLALTQQLAERGTRVLATDVHDSQPESLASLSGVDYRTLDVTSPDDWAATRAWVHETYDGLDILINNAGVATGGKFDLSDMDTWQWLIDINLLGVVRGCQTFAGDFKAAGHGHIVNTASLAGLVHAPVMSEYNTAKAGVVALSETLRHELSTSGVQVSVICPSFFRTNLSQSLRGNDANAQRMAVRLIDGARRDADQVAASTLAQLDKGKYLIKPDIEVRAAYAAKRFARPAYDFVMKQAGKRLTR